VDVQVGLGGAGGADDGLPAAGVVAVGVLRDVAGAVGDAEGLDVHGEGTIAEISHTTGPFDSSGSVGSTSSPDAETNLHRCLRVLAGDVVRDGAHDAAVDQKVHLLGTPVDGVLR